ncbi:MAG TPA: META domain-containing protein [Anaerolineae bacterium]|nr:META domain-containing protein [Anaerolineae bacterium]
MKKLLILVLFGALAVTIAACGGQTPTPTPQLEPTAEPVEEPTAVPEIEPTLLPEKETVSTEPIIGVAPVDSAKVTFENEQWVVAVEGNLPDGRTEINEITQSVEGSVIKVEVSTARPADMMCTQVITPYSESVVLETADLPNGEYTVEVNGVAATEPVVLGEEHMPEAAAADITNIVWQWTEFQDTAGKNDITVDNPENYTVTFLADNQVSIKADCNMVNGSYTLDGSSLTIQLGPSTMAFCGEESLDQQFLGKLGFVAAYVMDGDNLVMNLQADAGNMIFANGGPVEEAMAGEEMAGGEAPVPAITGITWQWVNFTDPVNGSQDIVQPERYQMTLNEDGTINIKADCNTVSGTYTLDGSNIEIILGPTTLAACPEDSLADQFQQNLDAARIYFMENGDLLLDLMADGGTMRFSDTNAAPPLAGTTWQWVGFVDPVADGPQEISQPERYELTLNEDGTASIKADCNQVSGAYTIDGSSIEILPGPSTLAACPEDSLGDQFVQNLTFARIYFFQNGDLFMDLMADGGTMQFRAADAQPAIVGTTWKWVTFSDPVNGLQTIPEADRYQMTLNDDGTINVQADCNQVSGAYTLADGNVEIVLGPSTLAACPEDSLADQFLQNLTNARIYFTQDGSLFFDLLVDGGTMRFDPATQGEVTGTVTYMVRSALPNDAVLTVQIQDTSLADAPATVMGESWYVTGGAQVPLPFAVAYNPEFIQDNRTYTLSVRITDGEDNLLFINDTSIPVITNGNPTTDIEVVVVPAG